MFGFGADFAESPESDGANGTGGERGLWFERSVAGWEERVEGKQQSRSKSGCRQEAAPLPLGVQAGEKSGTGWLRMGNLPLEVRGGSAGEGIENRALAGVAERAGLEVNVNLAGARSGQFAVGIE